VTVFGNVDPVEAVFLGGEGGFGCIEFEIPAFAVEVCETNRQGAFDGADCDSFIAQRDDAQDGVAAETNEIAGVDLYFEFAIGRRANCVAFDERIVQLGCFPILAVAAFQVNLTFKHADAHDASFHVVIVGIVIVVGAGGDGK
jgi:hypothetical protein